MQKNIKAHELLDLFRRLPLIDREMILAYARYRRWACPQPIRVHWVR